MVLHTRFSSVVFPALALPITRTRKRVYLARSFAASRSDLLRNLSGIAFFSRLRIPLDSLAVCWRSSAISTRVGEKNRSFVCNFSSHLTTLRLCPILSVGCYLQCYLPGTFRPERITPFLYLWIGCTKERTHEDQVHIIFALNSKCHHYC